MNRSIYLSPYNAFLDNSTNDKQVLLLGYVDSLMLIL